MSAFLKSLVKQGKILNRGRNYSSFMVAMSMWSWAAEEHQQLAHPLWSTVQALKLETASPYDPGEGDRLQMGWRKHLWPTLVATPQPTEAARPSGKYFDLLTLTVEFHKTPITKIFLFTHGAFLCKFILRTIYWNNYLWTLLKQQS